MLEWLRSDDALRSIQFTALVVSRLLPLVILTPIFGGEALPARLRFGIAIVLALALGCGVYDSSRPILPGALLTLLVCKELLIGVILALLVTFVFQAAAIFGALIDQARGQGAITISDPHTKQQQTAFSIFSVQLAVVCFLSLGGHIVLLSALADSYRLSPIDEIAPAQLNPKVSTPLILRSLADMMSLGVRLAAPALIVTTLVDVVVGLITRAAQQIDVGALTLGAKGLIVLAITTAGLAIALSSVCSESLAAVATIRSLLEM